MEDAGAPSEVATAWLPPRMGGPRRKLIVIHNGQTAVPAGIRKDRPRPLQGARAAHHLTPARSRPDRTRRDRSATTEPALVAACERRSTWRAGRDVNPTTTFTLCARRAVTDALTAYRPAELAPESARSRGPINGPHVAPTTPITPTHTHDPTSHSSRFPCFETASSRQRPAELQVYARADFAARLESATLGGGERRRDGRSKPGAEEAAGG